ncbi:PREDICTED: UPF0488 protein C8orf33 homolog [Branchiostoma belcheri]|uniref:UPF0488 protein C8orf33 homolog n=1 Tax=Branchiostoma belcheri TaxID=7741 RepID=A0A6P4ZUN2_BRABE|nr:PREDICTED: UPF0488 protein C8orf33 homolog [Branchiostoma belcheri]
MADAGTDGGKSKNKNRRRREKEKKKKQHQGATTSGAQDEDVEEESPVARFERELAWCVDQLEAGLQNMKPDEKQMKDTMKILHTLKSPKASMPKKRQMMWAVFGDYRKKILEEERKSKQAIKRMKLEPATQQTDSGRFFRKSTANKGTCFLFSSEGSPEERPQSEAEVNVTFESSDAEFKFNFPVDNSTSNGEQIGNANDENLAGNIEEGSNVKVVSSDGQPFQFNFAGLKIEPDPQEASSS